MNADASESSGPLTVEGPRLLLDGRRIPPDTTLIETFADHVARQPSVSACHFLGMDFTWAELEDLSSALAAALSQRGILPGDRIALQMQNCPQFIIAVLAAWKLGAAVTAIGPMYRERETRGMLELSGAVAVITHTDLWERDGRAASRETDVHTVVTTDLRDMGIDIPASIDQGPRLESPSDAEDFLDLTAEAPPADWVPHFPDSDDLALIAFTSGTTGPTKGTRTLHRNLIHGVASWTSSSGVDHPSHVQLSLAPFVHITGIVANIGAWIWSGCRMVVLPRFDPKRALELISEQKISWMVGAATVYTALLQEGEGRDYDTETLDVLVCGGAPIPSGLEKRLLDAFGAELRPGYGMTETTTSATVTMAGQRPRINAELGVVSVGQPAAGVSVRIRGFDGTLLGADEIGEVVISGDNIIDGYWENPEESAKAIEDGWMRTGDIGYVDSDGWLYLIDRAKNMIVASGYKVWPREIEETILKFHNILEVAVIGVPDEYRGETVKGFISLRRPDEGVDIDELREHCSRELAAYKIPRIIEVLDELPKNANGKIQHTQLRRTESEQG